MRRTQKCTRVADRAFPEINVTWRQPGDFGRSLQQEKRMITTSATPNLSTGGSPFSVRELLSKVVFE
jgi:hypothetical protein